MLITATDITVIIITHIYYYHFKLHIWPSTIYKERGFILAHSSGVSEVYKHGVSMCFASSDILCDVHSFLRTGEQGVLW